MSRGGKQMNRGLVMFIIFTVFVLNGCSNNGLSGEKPPKALIEIGNETYETTLGTYCWDGSGGSICVDTVGPVALLKGKDTIEVQPGQEVTLVMNYQPKPNETNMAQITGNEETEVKMKNNRFSAPVKKGVYYFSYGVWWLDGKDANVSNGDAFYAFALEVK